MQKYLAQLLEDLEAAHRPATNPVLELDADQSINATFAEVERYISGEDELYAKKFSEVCGVEQVQLPPVEKLTDIGLDEFETLCVAIRDLLYTWNLNVSIPEDFPADRKYPLLRDIFDTKTMITNSGFITIELCDYNEADCVFEEYCTCKIYTAELEEEEKLHNERAFVFAKELDRIFTPTTDHVPIILSTERVEIQESEDRPIKTLGEWLGVPMDQFPNVYPLSEERANKISEIIMRLWPPDDEMTSILRSVGWQTRYKQVKNYLESKVWSDGQGTLYFIPMTDEERAQIKSPLDELFKDNLFKNNLENEDWEEDPDMPF